MAILTCQHDVHMCVLSHSSASDSFETPWTAAYQAPLSVELPSNSAGVGCHFLLQMTCEGRIFRSGCIICNFGLEIH